MSDTIMGVRGDGGPAADGPPVIYALPAPIVRAAPDAALIAAAQLAAFDPAIFADRAPFFVRTVISNASLDAYGTRMHESTLRNFAEDAANGVSVQNAHNTRQLGFGRSVTGVYIPEQSGQLARVESDFYTIPGLRLNDVNTDDLILGIRSGLVHDISVGFYGGTMACSICGRAYWDWDCMHIPFVEYELLDAKGNTVGTDVAFFWIKDAHLSEYSTVYDGATSGAEIIGIKAEREAEAGRLRPETVQFLNQRFRLNLPGNARPFGGATLQAGRNGTSVAPPPADGVRAVEAAGGPAYAVGSRVRVAIDPPHMPGQTAGEVREAVLTYAYGIVFDGMEEMGIHKWYVESEVAAEEPPGQEVAAMGEMVGRQPAPADVGLSRAELERALALMTSRGVSDVGADLTAALTRLLDERDTLTPLAADGRAYRADLVNDALAEGVRAYGEGFATETYQRVLEGASLDVIKRMRDDWRSLGDQRLPGGRSTTEGGEPAADAQREASALPAYAFRA